MIEMHNPHKLLTTVHISKLLGISIVTANRYCNNGSIKAVNYNSKGKRNTWRIEPVEIEKLMGMKMEWDENGLPYLVSNK